MTAYTKADDGLIFSLQKKHCVINFYVVIDETGLSPRTSESRSIYAFL